MNPLERYMLEHGMEPWPFQKQVWEAYLEGKSGLIDVPTGSGKTYAAFGGPLTHLVKEPARGIQILYITPLRATTSDVEKALRAPVEHLNLPFRVEMRTGDTSSSKRLKQKKTPPEILLTTPESLALLLSQPEMLPAFSSLKAVIVDEWHELMGTKRGVVLELLLAQLYRLTPCYRLWGMSATLGNMEESSRVLGGSHHHLIRISVEMKREVIVETILPNHFEELPWSGYFGLNMLSYVIAKMDPQASTLLFTNTRAQAEKWFLKILESKPEWKELMAIHHSSLALKERHAVEERIKNGELRFVICTSSLDLGVDFSPVEKVIQIGSTKSISRLIQRAGRSNHRPFAPCHISLVPTHALELISLLSLRLGLEKKCVESRTPLKLCWDVLIQFCNSRGCIGFTFDELWTEVTSSYAFQNITPQELKWVITFLEKGGECLKAYPEFHKLSQEDGRYFMQDARQRQLHRMSMGTISSNPSIELKLLRGKKIGSLDEAFITKLKKGDQFTFGGKSYEFLFTRNQEAFVKIAKTATLQVTQWQGSRLPVSYPLSSFVQQIVEATTSYNYPEALFLANS